MLQFQRLAQVRRAPTEKSVVFVGPGPLTEVFEQEEESGAWLPLRLPVELLDNEEHHREKHGEAGAPASAGGHWLAPIRTLPESDARNSGSGAWACTLPVLDLEGSRESKGFGGRIVGRSTSARAVRVGLVAAAIFSVVAARGVAWNAPSWGAFVMPDFVFGAAAPGGAPAPFPAEPPAPAPAPAVVAAPAVLTFEALSIDSTPAALPQSTAPAAPSAAPVTAPGVVPSFGPLPAAPPRTEMARL